MQKTTLPNGIRILTKPDSHFSSALLAINVISGLRDEDPEIVGVTHFLEHMLFKKTEKKSTKEIANLIDSLGGEVNAFTDVDSIAVHGEVPPSRFAELTEFLSELLFEPVFTQADFDLEKEVIRQEILEATDGPADLVALRFHEVFWKGNILAYPVFGTKESLAKITLKDVEARYKEIIKGSRIVISATGNFKEAELLSYFKERLSGLEPGEIKKPAKPIVHESGLELIKKESQQVHLALGKSWPNLNDESRELAELLCTVMGGGMSSRLFQKLREEKGLVYDVDLDTDAYLDTGIMMISAVVERTNLDQTLEIVFEQLDQASDLKITEEEFERARSMILAQLEMCVSDLDNQLWHAIESEVQFGNYLPISETIERYKNVSFSELQSFVDKWLRDKKYLLVLGGDINTYEVPEHIRKRLL